MQHRGFSRRSFLKWSAGAVGATLLAACGGSAASEQTPESGSDAPTTSSSSGQAPAVITGVTLRVVGTGVTLLEPIREQAEKDLGIKLEYDVKDGPSAQQKAATQPQTWDLYDQWFNSVKIVWGANVATGIDINRLTDWDKVSALTKEGKLTPDSKEGDGDAPYRLLYVQSDNTLGSSPTEQISMLPLTFNVDSFGYHSEQVDEAHVDSWAILFNPQYRGKIGLYNDPSTGLMDLALGAQAAGMASFQNIGNMTREEIDTIMEILIAQKREGQFRAFWNSFDESVNLMASGEVVIESMWSPAVTALQVRDVPVIYASPKEGYRGWHGGIMINKQASDKTLDACYEYLNWWMNGWAGALVARQGYYFSIPEAVKQHLPQADWDYWYEGQPAAEDLTDPFGDVVAKSGSVRDGGDFETRMSNIAVWNSVMDEHQYVVTKWNEFLSA